MSTALESAILAETGIISYFPMADTSAATALDRGPNTLTGSYDPDCQLGVVGLNGKPGGAVKFADITNLGQVLTGAVSTKNYVTGNCSVEFCIRNNRIIDGSPEPIFDAHGSGGPEVRAVGTTSGLAFYLKKHSFSILAEQTSGLIKDNHLWHHVVLTWDGTTCKIWVDGAERQGTTTSQTFATGGTVGSSWGNAFTRAALCHGAYYEKALTAEQVATHYAAFQSEVAWPTGTTKYGVHQGFPTVESKFWSNQIAQARKIHATVSRCDMRWDQIQTTEGGSYNWTATDEIFSKLAAGGFKTLVMPICFTPTWANGGASNTNVPGTSSADTAFTTWLGKFETFAAAVLERYKKGGVGNPTGIDVFWEIWNEANTGTFWTSSSLTPAPNAPMYAALYKGLRAKILSVDATAKVVFACSGNWNNTGVASVVAKLFIKEVVAVGGVSIDYAAYHAYTQGFKNSPDEFVSSTNIFDDVLTMYDYLISAGYTTVKMIVSEFGWSTAEVTEAKQSEYIKTGLERIRDFWSSFVAIALVYRDYDAGGAFGLFKTMPETGEPEARTSASTFSTFAAPFDTSAANLTLSAAGASGAALTTTAPTQISMAAEGAGAAALKPNAPALIALGAAAGAAAALTALTAPAGLPMAAAGHAGASAALTAPVLLSAAAAGAAAPNLGLSTGSVPFLSLGAGGAGAGALALRSAAQMSAAAAAQSSAALQLRLSMALALTAAGLSEAKLALRVASHQSDAGTGRAAVLAPSGRIGAKP